jgi:hypothetical protein
LWLIHFVYVMKWQWHIYWGARVAQWVRSLDLTTHTSLSPIRSGFAPGFINYKKGCTRLSTAGDKVYQLLAHGRWFSPASSTTKTGCHDIAEILLKVALKHQKSKSNHIYWPMIGFIFPMLFSDCHCCRHILLPDNIPQGRYKFIWYLNNFNSLKIKRTTSLTRTPIGLFGTRALKQPEK